MYYFCIIFAFISKLNIYIPISVEIMLTMISYILFFTLSENKAVCQQVHIVILFSLELLCLIFHPLTTSFWRDSQNLPFFVCILLWTNWIYFLDRMFLQLVFFKMHKSKKQFFYHSLAMIIKLFRYF